ncbi:MAG: Apre_1838 family putative sactipeptide bacteriocin [Lachnospiraceae bacterium]|jgi:putative bacteriocin precursor, CLOSPO_01332 family|nr:Apre_1838 family putative sactipeptide bacteriocin [Lachnospiraceae bacterium]
MKLVNPVGRTVATGVDAKYGEMRACMCSSGFSSARGTVDACGHCGCNCNGNYSYNSSDAVGTNRISIG